MAVKRVSKAARFNGLIHETENESRRGPTCLLAHDKSVPVLPAFNRRVLLCLRQGVSLDLGAFNYYYNPVRRPKL